MAGYIFALGKDNAEEIFTKCAQTGIYSTNINSLASIPFEATLGDYITMKEGDNVYFFFNRKIYGIGVLKNIQRDCKYSNYPNACKLETISYKNIENDILVGHPDMDINNRWICTFEPSPSFFKRGVDMDDVLQYKPHTFKRLRCFWKTSFIKVADEENQSLKEIIRLRNEESNENNIIEFNSKIHQQIDTRITHHHYMNTKDLLSTVVNSSNKVKHEMAVEVATLDAILNGNSIFGNWDFLTHQLFASPFKPIEYMDKIDVFGYKFIPETAIPSKYLIIELKKDSIDTSTITQVMKYVDWVCREYAYGDYSRIECFVLGSSITNEAIDAVSQIAIRNYSIGTHPIENRIWNNLKLTTYSYENSDISYTIIS